MYKNNRPGKYDDIINLPHHVSKTRPQMPVADRAAQFSPFAALTGHSAAIQETARLTDEKIELDESTKRRLDETFQILMSRLSEKPIVQITYFVQDERKMGGSYLTMREQVRKIDLYRQQIQFADGTMVAIQDITDIVLEEREC